MLDLDKLLRYAVERGASDVHLKVGSTPFVRVDGRLERTGHEPLTPVETERIAFTIMPKQRAEEFLATSEADFAYSVSGLGRFRCNVLRQRGSVGLVLRRVQLAIPSFEELGLPPIARRLAENPRGLVLVTGPTGSGKTTTLAAMVDHINETMARHIVTIEDPIEVLHQDKKCIVNQREIGKHSNTFASALRAALREDPDVIIVGELRDQETMTLAMTAAETGHLVIATMHTTSAVKTIDRLVEAFPPREQPSIRMMLSESLKVVVNQQLVRRADRKGRVAYHEVLMVTSPIRNLIRDQKTNLINSAMTIGKESGMQTLDMALQDLVAQTLITPEDAYLRAEKKELFEALVSKEFIEGMS